MTRRSYALDQLTALELDPLAFVDAAADAGYDAVGLYLTSLPFAHAYRYDLTTDRALFEAFRSRLRDRGVGVHVVEPFLIAPEVDRATRLRNLDLGAALGAAVAGTLGFDPDPARRAESLHQLAEDAHERGLSLTVEPYFFSNYPTLTAAAEAARAAGPHAGITLDVLHIVRGGEHWEAVHALEPGMIRAIQLSDGPIGAPADRSHEATADRGVPGDGAFDLTALLPLLPPGVPIGIEVPSLSLAGRLPAVERARYLQERVEQLFARSDGRTARD